MYKSRENVCRWFLLIDYIPFPSGGRGRENSTKLTAAPKLQEGVLVDSRLLLLLLEWHAEMGYAFLLEEMLPAAVVPD